MELMGMIHHISEHGAGFDFNCFTSKPITMNKNFILKADILDIIFDKRNKSYGAYDLRKFYPGRLKVALGLMFLVSAAFSAFTMIPKKEKGVALADNKPDIVISKVYDMPKEEIKKPEVKEPEVKTETKPAAVSPVPQKAYTNNIAIVDKTVKTDSIVTLKPEDQIGNTTIVVPNPGQVLVTPVKTTTGGSGTDISTPKTDVTTPRDAGAVDVAPAFPGGMDALTRFLQKNLHTPDELQSGETVSVRVRFVVGYNGKLQGFSIVQDGGEAYNKEVVRVLKKMPDWVPGKAMGENVSVYHTIPVKFVMTD